MSTIQTLGGALSGMIVEAVVDPRDSNHLRLHTWNGRRATTTTRLEHNGTSYIPMNLTSRLVQSVRFARPSVPFGSTHKLILSLRDFLSKYSHLQPEVADLLVAFAFATWFCDCMPMAPVLRVFGPENAVGQLFVFLGVLVAALSCWGTSILRVSQHCPSAWALLFCSISEISVGVLNGRSSARTAVTSASFAEMEGWTSTGLGRSLAKVPKRQSMD